MKTVNRPFNFDNPFRPNYELWTAGMWTAGTAGTLVLTLLQDLPLEPLAAAGSLAAVQISVSLPGGIRLYRRQQNLIYRELEFITFDELLRKNSVPGTMWIGTGFEWEHRHAQLASQLAAMDQSCFRPERSLTARAVDFMTGRRAPPPVIGQPWIHGLETREVPLYQELKHAEGHTLIVGTTGAGKAQPLDCAVLTPSGWRCMGELKVGDFITDPGGKPRRISGIFPRGVLEIYEIILSDGRRTRCSMEHLWRVITRVPAAESASSQMRSSSLTTVELGDIITLMRQGTAVEVPELERKELEHGKFTTVFREIKKIVPAGMAECRCIMVDSAEHLYITDDLIITHNTRMFDLLISEAVARNETVIIIDPKGDKELAGNAERACRCLNQSERFLYFNPAFPEKSFCIDPLHNFSRPTEIASRISALMPSESGSGSTFKAFSWQALNNIIQGMVICRVRPQLVTIRHYLESGAAGLVVKTLESYLDLTVPKGREKYSSFLQRIEKQRLEGRAQSWKNFYREELAAKYPNSDIEGLLSMYEHDTAHFSKMVAGLLPIMNMLTSGILGPMLSPDPQRGGEERLILDTARIINSGGVAYFGLDSLTDGMVGSAIGSLILSDLTAVAGDRYNYGVDNRPVNVFVDEAAEVINEPFIQLLNKGRGAGLRLFVATQTFADFAARLGSADKATQVLGNINNIFALRVTDVETQTYITDKIPKTRISTLTHTLGQSTDPHQPVIHSGSQAQMLKEEEADLFAPALLGQLPNLEFIGNISGGKIVKGRIPILTGSKSG